MARVTLRYQTGTTTGHYVAPSKVRERYVRTLALLPRAAEVADAVFIYDNSVDYQAPKLQAVIERDVRFSVAENAKDWVYQFLVYPLQQRERELDQLITALEMDGHELGDTDELRGTYQGAVLSVTTYYLAQLDDATNLAMIHDRLMLDTGRSDHVGAAPTYAHNENLTVKYAPASAPRVVRHHEPKGIQNG